MTTVTILADNGVSSGSAGLKTTGGNDGTLVLQSTTAAGTATTAQTIGTDQVTTFAQAANLPNTFGFKNRLINGNMVIDQRNAGASVATSSGVYVYTLDRWIANYSQTSKYTVQQTPSATETGYATRVAAGFTNYLAVTSSSAYSVGSSDYFSMGQKVEGYNMADLAWGTSNAKTVVLSFWVYSSLTGTFGGCVGNGSFNRSYPFTYTVGSANTWTQVSVTIPGDQSGTWNSTNGVGMSINWGLGVGSTYTAPAGSWTAGGYISANSAVNVVSTNGATWYVTGVQLEKGVAATAFDFRSYGQELALCQRYYWRLMGSTGQQPAITTMAMYTATSSYGVVYFPVPMRANPTSSYSLLSDFLVYSNGGSKTPTSILSGTAQGDTTVTCAEINTTFGSSFTAGNAGWLRCISTTTGYLEYSAEL